MRVLAYIPLLLTLAVSTSARSQVPDPGLRTRRYNGVSKALAPRAPQSWQTCQTKGSAYLSKFGSNCQEAVTNTKKEDLTDNGWTIGAIPQGGTANRPDPVLKSFIKSMKDNLGITVGNKRDRWFERRASIQKNNKNAYYINLYGPKDKTIVAERNDNENLRGQVEAWSEATWAIWADTCEKQNVDPKALKRIIRHQVDNPTSKSIIGQVYSKAFPNKRVGDLITLRPTGATKEAFEAVVGSPNGKGVAWMLLNKRNVMNNKRIESISIQMIEDPPGSGLGDWEILFSLN